MLHIGKIITNILGSIIKKPFIDQIREIALKYKGKLRIDKYNG